LLLLSSLLLILLSILLLCCFKNPFIIMARKVAHTCALWTELFHQIYPVLQH
jgi:hypothetical protein